VVAPGFIWPEYTNLAQRFFSPWGTPGRELAYTLTVEPGDQAVRRGTAVTFRATLKAVRPGVELPTDVLLVQKDGSTTALTPDGESTYTLEKVLTTDLTYHCVAGEATTPEFTLRALWPVELAPEQPVTTITPPLYAASVRETDTLVGLAELEGLQHSRLTMQVQLTRPAESATLHVTPREGEPSRHVFSLDATGLAGSVEMPLTQTGRYHLVIVSREGLTETIEGATLTVSPDRAPEVLERDRRLPGLNRPLTVSPYDAITLSFEADDDIAVAGAVLEYRTDENQVQTQPIDLARVGPRTYQARTTLKFPPEQLKAASKLRYRVRIEDNRPNEYGGPNVTLFPAQSWVEVEIGKENGNMGAEILAQRDSINLKLNQLIDDVARQWRATNKVRQETRDQPKLEGEQREQVREIEQQIRQAEKEIEKLVQDHQDERGLEPLLQGLEQIRRQEIEQAQQALKQAGAAERASQPRDNDFARADQNLDEARRKLEELRQKSNEVAQQRLDQARAEQLAREQEKLAEKARELAAQDPMESAPTKEQLEELARKQQELAKELEKLAENSPALQEAMKQLQPEAARELGKQAEDLAREQRELAKQQDTAERQPLVGRLEDLAKKQEELARKQEDLGQKTKPQVQSAAANPLDPKEARDAAEALRQGNAQEASDRQEKAAQELENLAKNLERAAALAQDPRKATEQLARQQAELKQQVLREPANRPDQVKQQKALEQATRDLKVDRNDIVGQARRDAAAARMAEAQKELERNNSARAQDLMEMARNYLDQLAKTQPTQEQVEAKARQEVDRLKAQQEQAAQLARQADQARTPAQREQKLAEAARKQAETAEALSKLELPQQAPRLERVQQAANEALRDLLDRKKENIAGSQEEAKRQLDRLAQAMRGEKPPDEKAAELAREQRQLAQEAEALAKKEQPQKDEVERLKKKQRDLAKKADEIKAPEAQKEVDQARRAMQQAGQDQSPADLAKQAKQAAEDVDRLLRRIENP
jgi:hypothetical protein